LKVIQNKTSNYLPVFKTDIRGTTETSLILEPNLKIVFKKTDYNKKPVPQKKD
jgi:hypothetical protein